eukprot:11635507-Prorocentrum_lima.AAC.1
MNSEHAIGDLPHSGLERAESGACRPPWSRPAQQYTRRTRRYSPAACLLRATRLRTLAQAGARSRQSL